MNQAINLINEMMHDLDIISCDFSKDGELKRTYDAMKGILKEARDKLSSLPSDTQGETLEDIIEDIGKGMCHLDLLYPNAGYWNLQSGDQFDYKGEDLKEAFKAFRGFLKAQKLI